MFQPSLFLSHGAPDIALKNGHPTHRFFRSLPEMVPRPDAVVILSAHWCTGNVVIAKDASYEAAYDFGGFDPRLYALQYRPLGSPDLAKILLNQLKKVDNGVRLAGNSGLDHGAWIPLMLMYPDADIPVVRVSIQPHRSPSYHYDVGAALADLRNQNVLVVGSGAMTHNLYRMSFDDPDASPPAWVSDFTTWMKDRLEAGDRESLLQYRRLAPFAAENHPTDEHLAPLFIAMGAGDGLAGSRIHTAVMYKTVMMDAYAFNGDKNPHREPLPSEK